MVVSGGLKEVSKEPFPPEGGVFFFFGVIFQISQREYALEPTYNNFALLSAWQAQPLIGNFVN